MPTRSQRGYSLAEALTVVAILGLLLLVTVPAFASINRRMALRAATADLRALFHETRSRAIATSRNHGLKFSEIGGVWHLAVYEDGDGDGVRNDDIKKNIDRLLEPPRVVFRESRAISIGLLKNKSIKDPDGDPLTQPIAFNASTICSFSPIGAATPGSIYLTDKKDLWCVRVYGATARIRVLRYDASKKRWIQ